MASNEPFQVSLPIFDGPLDLLLHLVRSKQLDIHEVRLADLTEAYLAHMESITALNLDEGGEFLAIASYLIWIKSKSLLPNDANDEEELDPQTLEEMLLLRLQDLQRIKDATVEMTGRDMLGRDTFPRQSPPFDADDADADQEAPFEEVSLYHLLEAFSRSLERSKSLSTLHIIPERNHVEDKVEGMLARLEIRQSLFLDDFLMEPITREDVILIFLTLLELVRLKAVRVRQATTHGEVLCEATEVFNEGGQDFKQEILSSFFGNTAGGGQAQQKLALDDGGDGGA